MDIKITESNNTESKITENTNIESGLAVTRWIRLAGAAAVLMVLGVLYAWSIFRAPLSEMFPTWTPVDMSWIFTITMLGFLLGGVISGRLTMKLPHRIIVLVGAALLFAGFFGASHIDGNSPADSLVRMFVCYGILCGLGIGMPYNAILGAILKWFPNKEGLASGVMLMGFGFGGLVLGSTIGALISSFGIEQTFVILALGVAAVCCAGAFIVRAPNERQQKQLRQLSGDEAAAAGAVLPAGGEQGESRREYTASQMVRTGAFLILVLWMIAGATGGLMVMNSAASIAIFYGSTAGIGLIATVFNGVGRIAFGLVFDRIGSKPAMASVALCLVLSGAMLLIGATCGVPALILAGLPLTGLGYGGSPVISSAFVNRYFGRRNYASNLSIANLSIMASSVIGPLLSGKLQEMNGGAFTGTFAAICALGVCALALSFFVENKKS
jgi:OFA family oxalate/formate antiporter-like MFS transporter